MRAFFHDAESAIVGEFMKNFVFFQTGLCEGIFNLSGWAKSEDEDGNGGENNEREEGPPAEKDSKGGKCCGDKKETKIPAAVVTASHVFFGFPSDVGWLCHDLIIA